MGEYSTDSTYRSTATGASGIPHTWENIRPTPRTDLQLQEQVVFLTHRRIFDRLHVQIYSYRSKWYSSHIGEYSTDSTYRSTATGASGIPHTSYAHTSSGYSSENPYKNKVSSYSYNI